MAIAPSKRGLRSAARRRSTPRANAANAHHARFFDPTVVYHITCKTIQNRFLLVPDRRDELRSLCLGVIGRAQTLYEDVELYFVVFMSNHIHLLLRGQPQSVVRFIAFIKREVSRRWGRQINWRGPMWEKYLHAAMLTDAAQVRALRYLASHGVKEKLVRRAELWPGVHCAAAIAKDQPLAGHWVDGTRLAKQVFKERCKRHPQRVDPKSFTRVYTVTLSKLPAWSHLDDARYRQQFVRLMTDVELETAAKPGRVLGVFGVLATSRERRTEPPRPTWHEYRRRFIVWDDARRPEVRAFLAAYWDFQERFREASRLMREGRYDVSFPEGAFRPGIPPNGEKRAA